MNKMIHLNINNYDKICNHERLEHNQVFGFKGLIIKKPLEKDIITFKQTLVKDINEPYLSKMDKIKDIPQYNTEFPHDGEFYCGPVAASNVIMNLAEEGYSNITGGKNQVEVTKELAKFFKTDEHGSTCNNVAQGLYNFILSKGYKIKRLEYQGLREVDRFKKATKPNIDDLKKSLEKSGIVLLDCGYYKMTLNNGKPTYKREYEHWVPLVGHSYDGRKADENSLIIHDSFARCCSSKSNRYLKLHEIKNGTLLSGDWEIEKWSPCDANGYFEAENDLGYMHPDLKFILDGAVILELEEPK